MSDEKAQERLFYAITNLESSIKRTTEEKKKSLKQIEELKKEIKILNEKICELQKNQKNKQNVILDQDSSCEVDLSIKQLKNLLSRE